MKIKLKLLYILIGIVMINMPAFSDEKNKGLNFPNFISASLGGKNLEKMSPKVAAPQITASGIAGTWSMKKTFKTTQPSRMTGQYFKIPAGTEGEFEVSLALGEGADKFFKSSDYYVSFYEFGFTNLITYTEPKYVQTGNEIKFVAKFDKNSKPVKGFKIDKAFIFDFVKKTDIPLSFKEVSEGHFEATLTAPFKGREYVNLHPDNRIQYFIYASKKGKEASLHRQNVNHVYYHSTYCKVNGIKEWKYEKGKGLTISMDVDYMDKDKGSNYRSLIYLADKDGHQFAWGAYGPTKKVKLAANGKLYPSYFISDKALFWPGSFITEKDLVAGGIKVNARASLIKSNMKVISGNTCWNNTWMDLP